MALTMKITEVHAREILDSRGNPTVEVEVPRDGDNGEKDYSAGVGSVGSEHRKI